jgi:hypothetical protein
MRFGCFAVPLTERGSYNRKGAWIMYRNSKSDLLRLPRRRKVYIGFWVAVLGVAAALAVPARCNCYSIYSGTSVGSDGTIYGWGVTDGTPPPGFSMTHTAYVWTSLTSPKGRWTASSSPGTYTSGINVVQVDVSLPFDPNDLGTYTTQSDHGVW